MNLIFSKNKINLKAFKLNSITDRVASKCKNTILKTQSAEIAENK